MSRQNINVLVVDSEESFLSGIRGVLENRGYTVHAYSDPEKALRYLRSSIVQIALIDIATPDIGGMSFVGAVKEAAAMTQIIMTGAYVTADRVIAALESGANDFILKPFSSLEQIASVVEESEKKLIRWQDVLKRLGAV
ncbi:response regulator [bacterium]|nr:response regulator [bacterium]